MYLTNQKLSIRNFYLNLISTRSLESIINAPVPGEIKSVLSKYAHTGRYVGGSQHTRRSSCPAPTRQIQPSSRNLNHVSGEGGTRSSAAHSGRCCGGMGKRPWSVRMDLWLSKKETDVVRCETLNLKRRWACLDDFADATSQTITLPYSSLVSSRVPS